MRSQRCAWILSLALLAACQGSPGVAPRKAAAASPSQHPVSSAGATATPGATRTTGSSAAPASASPPELLAAPGTPYATLAGKITVDAAYLTSVGAGHLLSNNGASTLVLDTAGLVANNGGNAIPGAAAGVVATAAGALQSTAGGNVLAAGNVGAEYRLLADDAATQAVAAGTQLPGAGLLVSAVSLRTHQYLPVGVDGQGRPVYVVYSGADGGYQLYLPKDVDGNVLVVASVPGRRADDRAVYNVVSRPDTASQVPIDEDTALVGAMIHHILIKRLAEILSADATSLALQKENVKMLPAGADAVLDPFMDSFNAHAAPFGVPFWTDAALVEALATYVSDECLAGLPLDLTSGPPTDHWPGPDEPVLPALTDCMRALRDATGRKLQADPGFFTGHDFLFNDPCDHLVPARVEVRKASDLATYLVEHFLTRNQAGVIGSLDTAYRDVGLPSWLPPGGQPANLQYGDRIEAASTALLVRMLTSLAFPGDDQARAFAAIDTFCAAHPNPARGLVQHDTPCTPTPE